MTAPDAPKPAPTTKPTTPWLVAYYRRRLAEPLPAQDRAATKHALAYAEARLAGRAA